MADNKILKKTLRHYIDLDFYANTVSEELMEFLLELIARCEAILSEHKSLATKDSYNLIHRLLKNEISLFGTKLNERLELEAEKVKEKELSFLTALYGSALAVSEIATSRILFAPIDSRDTVKQFVERTEKNILRSYDNAARSGYIFGQSTDDIKEQAAKNIAPVTRGMENGIKTAIPSFAKTTDKIIFLNNEKEVVWCTTLDGKECLVCASYSGRHFKSVREVPPVVHNLCRCFTIEADSITGPIPTYEEYINSLTDKEQYHILGKNRYELWKNQGVHLNKFINNGRKLRLDEIDV